MMPTMMTRYIDCHLIIYMPGGNYSRVSGLGGGGGAWGGRWEESEEVGGVEGVREGGEGVGRRRPAGAVRTSVGRQLGTRTDAQRRSSRRRRRRCRCRRFFRIQCRLFRLCLFFGHLSPLAVVFGSFFFGCCSFFFSEGGGEGLLSVRLFFSTTTRRTASTSDHVGNEPTKLGNQEIEINNSIDRENPETTSLGEVRFFVISNRNIKS